MGQGRLVVYFPSWDVDIYWAADSPITDLLD